MHHQEQIEVSAGGQRLVEITAQVAAVVQRSGVELGVAHIYVRHTSCSLIIQENADPSVRRDLEAYLARLVPEGDSLYTHTMEGPDDMPAHVKGALTNTSEQVPIAEGRMLLGTWQGIYLWEHRRARHRRQVVVHVHGD